jgi:hypothetical protein
MWHLLPLRYQFSAIAFLAAAIAWGLQALVSWWTGDQPGLLGLLSLALTLISVVVIPALALLWRPLWRLVPALGRGLFPDCNGRWEGTLLSTWKNPQTGASTPPIAAAFWIRQGLFSTSVRMRTGESTSRSTRCWLEAVPDEGHYVIGYTYRNDPKVAVSHRSTQHDGVAWLEVDVTATPPRISGRYCTTRHTSGDIDVTRVSDDPNGSAS